MCFLLVPSLGIDIVFQFGVALVSTSTQANPGQAAAIQALHTYDVRILVLLVDDITSAGSFLVKASSEGALSSNTIMLGTASVTTSTLWLAAAGLQGGPTPAQLKTILGGYVGITPADNDWKVSRLCGLESPFDPPTSYQYTNRISIYPINSLSQRALSTHFLDTSYLNTGHSCGPILYYPPQSTIAYRQFYRCLLQCHRRRWQILALEA